jgi:hypothetical protein
MQILPGWNTVEGADKWGNIFTILGLVALAALVLFDVLAFLYGRRERDLITTRDAGIAAQRESQQQEERQRGAGVVGDLQRRLHDAEQKHNAASAQLKESAKEIETLKEQRVPRHLTADQINRLAAILAKVEPPPGIDIQSVMTNAESNQFADDFVKALNKGGWNLRPDDVTIALFSTDVVGISVAVRNRDDVQGINKARYLQNAFKEVGLDASVSINPSVPEHGARIVIGRKP